MASPTLLRRRGQARIPRGPFQTFDPRLPDAARFLALHFANEIRDRNAAEVMGHPGTDHSLSIPWMMAGLSLVANDVSPPEEVDKTWMICLKSLGPCALMDIVGLQTMCHVAA